MLMNTYQEQAAEFMTPEADNENYLALGLCEEAGEVAKHFAKKIRDGKFDEKAVMKELGDVLWFVAMLSRKCGYSLEDVARVNIYKLRDRKNRGVINGNGDER